MQKALYRFVGTCEGSMPVRVVGRGFFVFCGGRGQMVVVITLRPTHKKLSIDFLVLVSEACR